jgi:O-antigen/teichoic acid export membrane protein
LPTSFLAHRRQERLLLRSLIQSHSVRAGIIYGVGGICFAVGNLLLARGLTTQDFAMISVVLAVSQLASPVGLLGADTVINRNPINPAAWLARRVLLSSTVTGLAAFLLVWQLYDFTPALAAMVLVICVAATTNLLGAAFFRSRERFFVSLALTQGHNAVLAIAGLAVLFVTPIGIALPLAIIFLAYLATALAGWFGALGLPRLDDALPPDRFPWREGRTILVTSLAIIMLVQMERLLLPILLDNRALATFAVLAAVAGSPFRVLQMGVGYTLVPQLRNATSANRMSQVLRSEFRTASWLTVAAIVVVWLLAHPVVDWVTDGKYLLTRFMIAASLFAGVAKIAAAFGRSCVIALGDQGDLDRLRNSTWIAVAVALAGAVAGAEYGLVGVLFGVAGGWVAYAVRALLLARPLVRSCIAGAA